MNLVHNTTLMAQIRPSVPKDLRHHLLSKRWRKVAKWSKFERWNPITEGCHKWLIKKNCRWELAKLRNRSLENHRQIWDKHQRPWWQTKMHSSEVRLNQWKIPGHQPSQSNPLNRSLKRSHNLWQISKKIRMNNNKNWFTRSLMLPKTATSNSN